MERILIIDDNDGMRELLSQLLQTWSYTTATAGSLEEARNIVLSQEPFKVILCDYDLPDGNGLQFMSWLKWERQSQARFVLMSGSANFEQCRPLDFSFLAKPFQMDDLRCLLDELVGIKGEAH